MSSVKNSRTAPTLSAAAFDRLAAGGKDLLAHFDGQVTLRTRERRPEPAPRYTSARVAAVRRRLRVSQPVFAGLLNVSRDTVAKWEQDARHPSGPSARLLQIAEKHPEVLLAV